MLTEGKTDSELLQALVTCLTDNKDDLIEKLRSETGYDYHQRANIEVLVAIVHAINGRAEVAIAPPPSEDEHGDQTS